MPSPDLGTLVATVLGSSVLASSITGAVKAISDWGQRRQKASYSALRLALHLEKYSVEVADQVPIATAYNPDDRHDPDFAWDTPWIPRLPEFPTDMDWRELKPSLTSRCLTFETEISFAIGNVHQIYDLTDEDEAHAELRRQLDRLQQRSEDLARDLRHAYHLPALTDADRAL